MPRLPRKNLNSNFIHLIVQGINQEFIFSNDNLKSIYKSLIKKSLESYNIEILAYCIMGNHAHFLVFFENFKELSEMMRAVNTSYAMKYNKTNHRKGYVFRDRFFSQDILDQNHLFNCLVYIHFNPVVANLSNNLVNYKFSSYSEYLNCFDLVSPKGIRLIFGDDKNYMEQFHFFHNSYSNINNVADVDEKAIPPEQVIKQFELTYNKTLDEIKCDYNLFGSLLLELRKQSFLTLTEMSNLFNVSVYRLNKCIHKIIDKN